MFYKLFLHIFALILAAILHIFIGILTYFYTFLKIFALGYGAPPLGVHLGSDGCKPAKCSSGAF